MLTSTKPLRPGRCLLADALAKARRRAPAAEVESRHVLPLPSFRPRPPVRRCVPAQAQQAKGTVTGLPLPRYASLKSTAVNLREGPSKDHATKWIYQRAGLPVEIIAEFATWRRIRDSEGADGWVLHSLLSGSAPRWSSPGRRTRRRCTLRASPDKAASVSAQLQPGVVAKVKRCDGSWCRVYGPGYDGYIQQNDLWGVYPGENVE